MLKYELSREARRDLDRIWDYVFEQTLNLRIAEKVIWDLRDGLEFLAENPNAGHFRDDLVPKPMKFYSVHDYLILHQVDEIVKVVRILRASQDIPNVLDRE